MSLKPACVVRIFVGAGRPPARGGRFRGFDTNIDREAHRQTIEEIVHTYFPRGSTQYKTRGTWRGRGGRTIAEQSVVVEAWTDAADCAKHLALAEDCAAHLRRVFGQEAVAVIANDADGRSLVDLVKRAKSKHGRYAG